MNRKTFTIGSSIIFIVIFLGVLYCQYQYRFNIRSQPPSDKWAKEVKISSGNVTCPMKIVEYGNNYLVVHNDNRNIKLIEVDKIGNKLKEKTFTAQGKANNIGFFNNSENMYLIWNESIKGSYVLNTLKLDENFKVIEKKIIENIVESKQIDNNILVVSYEDRLEIIEMDKGKSTTIKERNTDSLAGVKKENGYLITYYSLAESMFKQLYYEDGIASGSKGIMQAYRSTGSSFRNAAVSLDGEYAYMVIEIINKGEFVKAKYAKFSLDGDESEDGELELNSNKYIKYLTSAYSDKGARFLGTTIRSYAIKDSHKDIVDFVVKDGKIIDYSFVSRSKELSIFPDVVNGMGVFASFQSQNNYNVYITSELDEFKSINNVVRQSEKKIAFSDVLEGFLYSLSYLFVIGLKWIFPALILMGIFSFLEYKFREKKKKILFICISMIVTLIKVLVIKDVFYDRFFTYLPQFINSFTIGLIICSLLSFICYYWSYVWFKEDTEITPIIRFGPALLLDSLFTLMIFVPFIV